MKKKLIGYSVQEIGGAEVKTLVGTQPRRTLDKMRRSYTVRKLYAKK